MCNSSYVYFQIVKKKKKRYINSIVAWLSQNFLKKRSIHGEVALKSRTFPLTGITELYMSLTVNVLVEQSASQNSGHCLASSLIVNSFFLHWVDLNDTPPCQKQEPKFDWTVRIAFM